MVNMLGRDQGEGMSEKAPADDTLCPGAGYARQIALCARSCAPNGLTHEPNPAHASDAGGRHCVRPASQHPVDGGKYPTTRWCGLCSWNEDEVMTLSRESSPHHAALVHDSRPKEKQTRC